jgi:DNA-binding Xre family transcriptional regulator
MGNKPYAPGEYKFQAPTKAPRNGSALVRKFFESLTERRITLRQAAHDAGLSEVTIKYWKSGRSAGDIITIEHLCKKYNIEITIP